LVALAAGVSEAEWSVIFADLRSGCELAGLDLLTPFSLSRYNARVSVDQRLPEFETGEGLGILIGNTRALWPAFTQALRFEPALATLEHPLQSYLESQLKTLLTRATKRRHRILWAHETVPRALPIQRLADAVGLASLSPSHLSIHPDYGPWIALRAVAVIDVIGPSGPPAWLRSPCAACAKPCLPALERALEVSGPKLDARAISENADAWIAIRDACPVGQKERYSVEQLHYHYAKDASFLRVVG